MEVVAFVFGIFGLVAYLETTSLKRRIGRLEEQLTKTEGTDYYESRRSLQQMVRSTIGEKIVLELKEDYMDADVINYGNTKHGSVRIMDSDGEWMRVHIESPKGVKEKLIRMEAVQRIRLLSE